MRKPYEPPLLQATKWIGTAAGIAGAILIALNIGFVHYGFVLFLISSVLWTAAAAAQREPALLVLQGVFAIIDVVGVRAALAVSDYVLVSVPPEGSGDPVLTACGAALSHGPQLSAIVYLSTIGVYGNHDGAWVDEESECRPGSQRSLQRRVAEQAWQDFGARTGLPVAILRLAGIYGPGQNALVNLKSGTARRIRKPGQIFNRIHVTDIARAIDAAFDRRADGIFNVTDDEPSPPEDPIAFAAELLGVEAPPIIPFEDARDSMSSFALSFYADVKRAMNTKLKSTLGVTLEFPTYREGLTALHLDCRSRKNS